MFLRSRRAGATPETARVLWDESHPDLKASPPAHLSSAGFTRALDNKLKSVWDQLDIPKA
jgi:hypothetical protein